MTRGVKTSRRDQPPFPKRVRSVVFTRTTTPLDAFIPASLRSCPIMELRHNSGKGGKVAGNGMRNDQFLFPFFNRC